MAKSSNQKLKLLALLDILRTQTDEAHPISVPDLITMLDAQGIAAERKSIYADVAALQDQGYDIMLERGRGYYLASREFELPELKLLVDSVQSSKFITEKKTLSLIRKIENLASCHDARMLGRQVFVRGRVKSMNESVYYNVDEISAAINDDQAIRFHYFQYAVSKERQLRKDGAFYEVSPFALLWDDENYYMLAWDAQAGQLKHYRVDKMTDITSAGRPREGREAFEKLDMSGYQKQVFGMFSGKAQNVKLRFENALVSAVIDRFGKDVMVIPDGPEHFTVSLDVVVSPPFMGWLFAFGRAVEVLAPGALRESLRRQALQTAAVYE